MTQIIVFGYFLPVYLGNFSGDLSKVKSISPPMRSIAENAIFALLNEINSMILLS